MYAFPDAGNREANSEEGYIEIWEKEFTELPLLERCARAGYKMTHEEEKAVEHNTETQLIGSIAGETVGYATGAAVMKGIPVLGKILT